MRRSFGARCCDAVSASTGFSMPITDAETCGFVVVFTAEELPVAETLEVVESLNGMHVTVSALVANRRSPADAGELLQARRQMEDRHLGAVRTAVPGVPVLEVPLVAGEAHRRCRAGRARRPPRRPLIRVRFDSSLRSALNAFRLACGSLNAPRSSPRWSSC